MGCLDKFGGDGEVGELVANVLVMVGFGLASTMIL